MADEFATLTLHCEKCSKAIEIAQAWTAGGMNDYGGYVLKCSSCGHTFHFRLGRDVSDSRVAVGATILDTYYDEMSGNKTEVLGRFGLA